VRSRANSGSSVTISTLKFCKEGGSRILFPLVALWCLET
jgi:hypothetical protein